MHIHLCCWSSFTPQAASNVPALAKQSNPSGVTGIAPEVQSAVSKAAQQAAEAVVKQGGDKAAANAAAQKASAAAVSAYTKLQKDNPNTPPATLAQVASDAAQPVVNQIAKGAPVEATPAPAAAAPAAAEPAAADAPAPAAGGVGPGAAAAAAAAEPAAPADLPPLANVTEKATAETLPKQAKLNVTGEGTMLAAAYEVWFGGCIAAACEVCSCCSVKLCFCHKADRYAAQAIGGVIVAAYIGL